MFIIIMTYTAPLTTIDQHLASHRDYLQQGYEQNYYIASGPQNPRTGGILISQLKDREQIEGIMNNDPFTLLNLADYEIIEFNPVKYHPDFAAFV
jgi:uncharacterized protein YciI